MAKSSPAIVAFNAGECSPLMHSRSDLQGYGAACFSLKNRIPTIQGPMIRRGGSGHVKQVKDTSDLTWLVPFIKARDDAVMIEFGDLYCRFYVNRAQVLTGTTVAISTVSAADPVVITTAAPHGYANGQDIFITGIVGMTELNNRWFRCSNVGASSIELETIHNADVDGTGYTAYASGGVIDIPYEIVSPYSAAALATSANEFGLDFEQDRDVLYITDRSGTLAPRVLTRTSATSWAFSTFDPNDGPWLSINDTTATMYVSAATGSVTLTASAATFTSDDVGRLVRIDQEELTASDPWEAAIAYTAGTFVRSEGKEYEAATSATSGSSIPAHTAGTAQDGTSGVEWTFRTASYGIGRITSFTSSTVVTITVLTRFPQTIIGAANASSLWRFGSWSTNSGYPTNVSFFLERIAFGGGTRIDLSVAGSESFAGCRLVKIHAPRRGNKRRRSAHRQAKHAAC